MSVSKFYVGQRVAIIGSTAEFNGRCGTVVSGCFASPVSGEMGHEIMLDEVKCTVTGGIFGTRSGEFFAELSQLRPIDDRPELATWEAVHASCGWMPGMGVAL